MCLLKYPKYFYAAFTTLIIPGATFFFSFTANAQSDSKAFGDSIYITNGLTGKIYLLAPNTRKLPDFDTMNPVNIIYADSINIPSRSWSSGFPGLRDKFEWFAIEYKGFFKAKNDGEYSFRLVSDDGSKLFIDNKLLIDNDGLHGPYSKTGKIKLDESRHSITIQYFQGPRYQIALQLFASLNNSKEEIFPGNNFVLYTKNERENMIYYFLILAGLIVLYFIFFFRRNSKKKRATHKE